MTDLVLAQVKDGVGTLTLNRPERHNAISDELFDEFVAGLHELIRDPSARCILIRAEGRSFCSGRDTAQLGHRVDGESDFDFIRRHQQVRFDTLDCAKPVVAAIQGYAIGGGFEIALAADVRIAANDAVFALPEIRYGLLPDTGGTQLLTPLIGPSRTKYLVLSGDRIEAQTALEWGAVDFVVPREELDERAVDLARGIAERDSTALALGKQLVDQAWMGAIRDGMRQELVAQTALFGSDTYRAQRAQASGRENDASS